MFAALRPGVRYVALAFLMASALLLHTSKAPTALERVFDSGKLTVIATNGPTTYYEGPEGYTGFEYQLAAAFAEYLGVELELIGADNQGDIFDHLTNKQGDFASAGIAVTRDQQKQVLFSSAYMQSTPQLIYHAGSTKPQSASDIVEEKIVIGDQRSHGYILSLLAINHPNLQWEVTQELDSFELLEKVHKGEVPYTIVDSHTFLMNQGLFSQARVAFDLSTPRSLAWAFPKQADQSLLNEANNFLADLEQDGQLAQLRERYFGHLEPLHSQGTKMFSQRISSRLPKYKSLLKTAARDNKLDWHFLAAMSYQESFWNPNAKSPTGVRGLMMLTRNTARELGVDNRLDPEQSINGGAVYFAKLRKRLPENIVEPDRSWMALAAYNMGMGHLEDARVLTERMGGNPDLWHDVKDSLPLLRRKKYYSTLKHGYARGDEAATYVQRIRHYYTVLSWHTRIQERKLALSQNNTGFQPASGSLDARSDWFNNSIL